jgi:hypothetical protein
MQSDVRATFRHFSDRATSVALLSFRDDIPGDTSTLMLVYLHHDELRVGM